MVRGAPALSRAQSAALVKLQHALLPQYPLELEGTAKCSERGSSISAPVPPSSLHFPAAGLVALHFRACMQAMHLKYSLYVTEL